MILEVPDIGKNPVVYLNGRHMPDHQTQNGSKILVAGRNVVVVQTSGNRPADTGLPGLALWRDCPLTHARWYFHGGLDDLDETAIIGRVTNWDEFMAYAPWRSGNPPDAGQPTFWRSNFSYHRAPGTKETIGLVTKGLKTGNVWLNGHNLGECPQKEPVYMPECWLKDGKNDLVVFDRNGEKPDQVRLNRYESVGLATAQ